MSHFLYNERCPRCSKNGNDRSGNNLAVYSDTHKYCFACGYKVKGDIVEKYKQQKVEKTSNNKFFNRSNVFDNKALIYLKKYGLTDKEIEENYFWDDAGFLVFDADKYQNARNFTGIGAKYISRGIIRGNEKVFDNTKKDSIVVVEDAISAIKVGRVVPCVPLHNSIVPLELILRLSRRFKNIFIWLDPDKQKESLREASKASLYFDNVSTIWAEKDPKDYSVKEIENYLHKKEKAC